VSTEQGEPVPQATIVVVGKFAAGYEKLFVGYSGRIRAFLERQGATVVRRQLVERTLYGNSTPISKMFLAKHGEV
jgi:hypothetical protein